jgi:hypothetical protein
MSTGTGSPRSSRTPATGSSPIANSATPRCEHRIRARKVTWLRNFPVHDFAQNRIWLAVITLAPELLAWIGLLALRDHNARR